MSDLDQLTLAIQEMGTNVEANKFVQTVFEEDNIQFLKYITQIWLNPEIPDKVMINGVTLFRVALRPSILKPIGLLTEKYFNLSDEDRDQIKKAIIRGLMIDNNETRNHFAYCLSIIIKIEKTFDQKTNPKYILKPTIFETYLVNLLQNQSSRYGQIGAIMAITEILANETYHPKARQLQPVPKLILDVSYVVFDKSEDIDEIDVEFKSECAKCICQAFRSSILSNVLSSKEDKDQFLQCLLPNTQIPNPNLHGNLIAAITQFCYLLYKQYLHSFNQETIVPYMEKIYSETIQPVAAVEGDDFKLEDTEVYARNVMRMWIKFAECEYRTNKHIYDEYHLNIVSQIAPNMDQLLFSFISTYQVEEVYDNLSLSENISYFAFDCLQTFSLVAPEIVYQHAHHVYESYLQEGNRKSVFISFVAAQIIFQIEETQDEDLFKILSDLIQFSQSEDESIVLSAYAAVITACECHPNICSDKNFFDNMLQAISQSIQNGSTNLVTRGLKAFTALLGPFSLNDEHSNLEDHFQQIIQMLMDITQRKEIKDDINLEHACYFAIYKYLSKLPQFISSEIIVKFAEQIAEQMQTLMNEHPDGGLQIRAWLSTIVVGIVDKLRSDVKPIAVDFLNILVPTCEEINSTKANINSHEDVISAICNIIYWSDQESEPFIQRLFEIAMEGISTQESQITSSSAILISHLFTNFKTNLIECAQNVLFALIECLESKNNNDLTMYYLFHAINSILSIGSEMESKEAVEVYKAIGEMLNPKRDALMNISVNLIPFLDAYDMDSEESAQTMFCELLDLFTSVMKAYDYEKEVNPEDSSKKVPSQFIAEYAEPFIEIINKGYELQLYNDSIGFLFCDYITQIISTFGPSNSMNIKIHNRAFKSYFSWSEDRGSTNLRKQIKSVKKYVYDKA